MESLSGSYESIYNSRHGWCNETFSGNQPKRPKSEGGYSNRKKYSYPQPCHIVLMTSCHLGHLPTGNSVIGRSTESKKEKKKARASWINSLLSWPRTLCYECLLQSIIFNVLIRISWHRLSAQDFVWYPQNMFHLLFPHGIMVFVTSYFLACHFTAVYSRRFVKYEHALDSFIFHILEICNLPVKMSMPCNEINLRTSVGIILVVPRLKVSRVYKQVIYRFSRSLSWLDNIGQRTFWCLKC